MVRTGVAHAVKIASHDAIPQAHAPAHAKADPKTHAAAHAFADAFADAEADQLRPGGPSVQGSAKFPIGPHQSHNRSRFGSTERVSVQPR